MRILVCPALDCCYFPSSCAMCLKSNFFEIFSGDFCMQKAGTLVKSVPATVYTVYTVLIGTDE